LLIFAITSAASRIRLTFVLVGIPICAGVAIGMFFGSGLFFSVTLICVGNLAFGAPTWRGTLPRPGTAELEGGRGRGGSRPPALLGGFPGSFGGFLFGIFAIFAI
jgi:hypothetical protein